MSQCIRQKLPKLNFLELFGLDVVDTRFRIETGSCDGIGEQRDHAGDGDRGHDFEQRESGASFHGDAIRSTTYSRPSGKIMRTRTFLSPLPAIVDVVISSRYPSGKATLTGCNTGPVLVDSIADSAYAIAVVQSELARVARIAPW